MAMDWLKKMFGGKNQEVEQPPMEQPAAPAAEETAPAGETAPETEERPEQPR